MNNKIVKEIINYNDFVDKKQFDMINTSNILYYFEYLIFINENQKFYILLNYIKDKNFNSDFYLNLIDIILKYQEFNFFLQFIKQIDLNFILLYDKLIQFNIKINFSTFKLLLYELSKKYIKYFKFPLNNPYILFIINFIITNYENDEIIQLLHILYINDNNIFNL